MKIRAVLVGFVLVAGCRGVDNGGGPTPPASGPDASVHQAIAVAPESPSVAPVLDRLAAMRAPRASAVARAAMDPERRGPHPRRPGDVKQESGPRAVERFEREGGMLRPRINATVRAATKSPADVAFPESAEGSFVLRDLTSAAEIAVTLEGAAAVPAGVTTSALVYPGALGGADVVQRPHPEGTEDYVLFNQRPQQARVVYDVALRRRVAGLRLVDSVVEFIDDEGAPRLRMNRPMIARAGQHAQRAAVSVEGCQVDENPAAPFDRAVTPPRAAAVDAEGVPHCRIVIDWQQLDVGYPAVLDPNWTNTGSMVGLNNNDNEMEPGRQSFALLTLQNGKAIAIGGEDAYHDNEGIAGAEIYDPAKQTWALTGPMKYARAWHTAHVLASGKVIAIGGIDQYSGQVKVLDQYNTNTSLRTAEIYDPGKGTWTQTPLMNQGRAAHKSVVLQSGDVLVAGGFQDFDTLFVGSSEVYSVMGNTWTKTAGQPAIKREGHFMERLPSGKVIMAGGYDGTNSAFTVTSEIYDPGTDRWSAGPNMLPAENNIAQWEGTSTMLTDGTMMAAGGYNCTTCDKNDAGKYLAFTQIYDPNQNKWTAGPPLIQARYAHTMTMLDCGNQVLVTGGFSGNNYLKACELYDMNLKQWVATAPLGVVRGYHAATLIPTAAGSKVLVSGGAPSNDMMGEPDSSLQTAELYSGFSGLGCACKVDGDCLSAHCSDGVCCDTACGGSCDACSVKAGAVKDGTCALLPKGNAGTPACAPYACTGASANCPGTCASNADCTGGFVCSCNNTCVAVQALGACCSRNDQCASGICANGVCCNAACGQSCQSCNLPGSAGTCTVIAKGQPGAPACAPYLCDGANAPCPNSCKSDADCSAGNVCDCNNTCVPLANQKNGACCSRAAQCASGFCANGVCCDTACNTACAACNLMGKVGTCSVQPKGQPGAPPCAPYLCNGASASCPQVCAADGDCTNGNICNCNNNCTPPQQNGACCTRGSQCQSTFCVGGICCNAACGGACQSCGQQGSIGTCTVVAKGAPGSPSCAPILCDGSSASCPLTCKADADCAQGNICDCNNKCVPPQAIGLCCTRNSQCASSVCANGVCCQSACGRSCESCNQMGSVGTCKVLPANNPGSPPCGAISCDGVNPTCPAACNNDSNCAPGLICNCNKQCVAPQANGACCTAGNQCSSTFCVGGICCNAACGGACQSCSVQGNFGTCQVLVQGAPGSPNCGPYVCNGVSTGCPNSCAKDSDCDANNICSCGGACVPKQANGACCTRGAQCASGFCVDGVCCDQSCGAACQACNLNSGLGIGRCQVRAKGDQGRQSCAPYVCDGASASCPSSCASEADCQPGQVCSCGGKCVPLQQNGSCCSRASQCSSGFCVNGYCCNNACNQACAACNVAGLEGTCSVVAKGQPGTPPCAPFLCDGSSQSCPNKCVADADCSAGNVCSCAGSCVPKQPDGACCTRGAQCASTFCVGGVCCNAACGGACQTCNAKGSEGTCKVVAQGDPGAPACRPYVCDGVNGTCPNSCAKDADCAGGNVCSCANTCVPPQANGQCCSRNAQCASGFCADGVCCDGACNGGCSQCNLKGSEGKCTVLPRGNNGKMDACLPYVCDGINATCPNACRSDNDCKPGSFCDCKGACVPPQKLGECCTEDALCASGHCANNVCCDTACVGACARCDNMGSVGTCSPAPKGNVGRPPCSPYACDGKGLECPTMCAQNNNTCDEYSACCGTECKTRRKLGQPCADNCECTSGFCADGFCCNSACGGGCDQCDLPGKEGTCSIVARGQPGQNPACAPVVCDGVSAQCPASCTDDSDCGMGNICTCLRQCAPPQKNGECCTRDVQCASNTCVDGICCDSRCKGACGSCNLPMSKGTCTPVVKGTPGIPACGGNLLCDGTNVNCPVDCKVDADCVAGMVCDCTNRCVPGPLANGICCKKDAQCSSNHCVDGVCCETSCTGDCSACDVPGHVGQCAPVPAGPPRAPRSCSASCGDGPSGTCDGVNGNACVCTSGTVTGGGCVCAVGAQRGSDGQGQAAFGILMLAALLGRRRLRRAR